MLEKPCLNYTQQSFALRQIKFIPVIKVTDKYLGELSTVSYRDKFQPAWITTELRNKMNKILGFENYTYNAGDEQASGALIQVEIEYRHKGFHFGEILRLSSIMAMLENKIKEFEIYSKDTAVYFHSKYGFEPAINQENELSAALTSILNHCGKGYEDIKTEAEQLLFGNIDYDKANALLKKYISRVLETKNEYKTHPFEHGMRMVLEDSTIKNNKDFFNGLFKKHGIDYTI